MNLENLVEEKQHLTIGETAKLLSVSTATIRNWIKTNVIHLSGNGINLKVAKEVKAEIEERGTDRLRSRANKLSSNITKEHKELGNHAVNTLFRQLLSNTTADDAKHIISALAIRYLMVNQRYDLLDLLKNDFELDSNIELTQKQDALLQNGMNEDFFGYLYLSSLPEKEKNSYGKFYTPISVAKKAVQHLDKTETIADPCCGVGEFLIAATRQCSNGSIPKLIGCDSDKFAVSLCRLNIGIFLSPECLEESDIWCATFQDSIDRIRSHTPATIVTNPPWGAIRSHNIKTYHDTAHEFISLILKHFPNAQASYLLPESLFEVAKHKSFRSEIASLRGAVEIRYIGKPFKGMLTKVANLAYNSKKATGAIHIVKPTEFLINKERITKARGVFPFFIGESDGLESFWRLLSTRPTWHLTDNCQFALGIVTGNNKKYVRKSISDGCEPCCIGKDIVALERLIPSKYIRYQPSLFQQCAPEHLLRHQNQIVYRFISDKIVATPSDGKALCLNSANLICLENNSNIAVAMLLQSVVAQLFFRLKFQSTKVLKSHLQAIPLPILNKKETITFEAMFLDLMHQSISSSEVLQFVDDFVLKYFRLDPELVACMVSQAMFSKQ